MSGIFNQHLVYLLVGMNDYVATLTLKESSAICDRFDKEITVVFQYTQRERERVHKEFLDGLATHGVVKAKVLNYGDLIEIPKSESDSFIEIDTRDIEDLFFIPYKLNNIYLSEKKRTSNRIEIEMKPMGGGKHWDNLYFFEKRRVESGEIILSPNEQHRYLALKLFFNGEKITEQEKKDVFIGENILNEYVGFHYFTILSDKGIKVSVSVIESLKQLFYKRINEAGIQVNKYLTQAGSSVKKLIEKDPKLTSELLEKAFGFEQKRLNILGKHPIYLDIDSYMHIITRHVEDYKFNDHFQQKDNFQWREEDIMMVIKNVVDIVDDEYQEFRINNPNIKFSKYGDKSIYYEGDYYTLHIEPTGRIATLYKNRKRILSVILK